MIGDGDEFGSTVLVGADALDQKPTKQPRLRAIVVCDGRAVTHDLPTSGEVHIGRFKGNTLSVDHDTLSRLHAILRVGPPITVEDLGSANGTFVRETRSKPGQQVPVSIGDLLRFGNVFVILQEFDPGAPH